MTTTEKLALMKAVEKKNNGKIAEWQRRNGK